MSEINQKLLEACEQASRLPPFDEILNTEIMCVRCQCERAISAARAQSPDDAMPLEESWLIGKPGWFLDHPGMVRLVTHKLSLAYQIWPSGKTSLNVFGNPVIDGPTRGEVRRLLAALGVKQ